VAKRKVDRKNINETKAAIYEKFDPDLLHGDGFSGVQPE
jgi:hypothetical protein